MVKSIDTYNDIRNRANRLLILHKGLMNTRKRGIRSDWKQKFCGIMHWAGTSQIERVDTKDSIMILREQAALSPDDFTHEGLDDLLRSAVVFSVSALDRYVHERVVRKIVSSLRNAELNRRQAELQIPASVAVEITDAVIRERQRNNKSTFRPANIIRRRLQLILHRRPFQSWSDIEHAFALIGITGLDGKLQNSLHLPDLKQLKAELDNILKKRNHIAHEGDLVRHQRNGNAHIRKNPISPKEVEDAIAHIDRLVVELDKIK